MKMYYYAPLCVYCIIVNNIYAICLIKTLLNAYKSIIPYKIKHLIKMAINMLKSLACYIFAKKKSNRSINCFKC